jgi:hypothetical protein
MRENVGYTELTSCSTPDRLTQPWGMPSCWVVPDFYGVQVSDFLKTSEKLCPSHSYPYADYFELNGLLIRYLFTIAKDCNCCPPTRYSTLQLLQRCLAINKETDVQLTALACFLISSKFYDVRAVTIQQLIIKSLGRYTTSQFIAKEAEVLELLDYNVHQPSYLYDKVVIYVCMLQPYLPEHIMKVYYELCVTICDLLHEPSSHKFLKRHSIGLLAAAVAQTVLLLLTKCDAQLPITLRLALISHCSVSEVCSVAKRILKFVLGRDIADQYEL